MSKSSSTDTAFSNDISQTPCTGAKWIWYPADFEIWLGNRFNNRRTERGAMFPPFWKQDSHWATVEFSREYELAEAETIHIWAEGQYNFMLDGKLQFGQPETWLMPAGRHKLNIKVHNTATPPALFIQGRTIRTDSSWLVTNEDKIWIDENGTAHGSGIYKPAASWCFDSADRRPSQFRLQLEEWQPVAVTEPSADAQHRSVLVDFGQETMGYIVLHDIKGQGLVELYYGESRDEAMDRDACETLDKCNVCTSSQTVIGEYAKAYRYVLLDIPSSVSVGSISMLYEFLPQDTAKSGSFACSDDELNRIWQVSAYTLDLTTREFMMDGIKRDRWTWSGDAIQSYLMNYYLRFDSETVKRTIRQLRGKDPVTSHINTILDYTFYWFKSVYDYYMFTGDRDFVVEMYPRMLTLMDYVLGRRCGDSGTVSSYSPEGHTLWAVGQPDDWIFVDWVDFPMHKRGILAFEQILFAKSLETMQLCTNLVGPLSPLEMTNLHLSHLGPDGVSLPDYGAMATALREQIDEVFWNEDEHGYMHALEPELVPHTRRIGLTLNPQMTKFPNMFAIIFDYASSERSQEILSHVMHNPDVPAINTPYMRFYELEALCKLGLQDSVLPEMKDYWGGMLREGATSFWEKYNPEFSEGMEPLAQGASPRAPHLTMYGRPYGKSLCHAWGASPLYLLGRYYLGVEPIAPGYGNAASGQNDKPAWTAKPTLASLSWMRGDVPTPYGPIHLDVSPQHATITVPEGIGTGTFTYAGQTVTVKAGQTVTI